MNLQPTRFLVAAAAAGLLLGGCSGVSSAVPSTTSVNPTSAGKLSFAVGTANIQGTAALNVAVVYRASDSLSASLTNTPTISGPSPFFVGDTATATGGGADDYSTIPGGPGVLDISSGTLTGTPQTVQYASNIAANGSSFGQSGGVFSQSLSPGNETVETNQAFSYDPYDMDVYGTLFSSTAVAVNNPAGPDPEAAPWGGPPAFDPNGDNMGLRDGLSSLAFGVVGIPEGFTSFTGITPAAGTYTMSLSVATGHNGSTPTFGKVTGTATITSTTLLPTLDPTAIAFTPDNAGGASFTIPASYFTGGVTEVYVQVVDVGDAGTNCQGTYGPASFPVYYTMVETAAGPYSLPDNDGPNLDVDEGPSNLAPSESICTAAANTAANGGTATAGDTYEVNVVGLDYDAYGNSYITSKTPPSQVTAWNGTQADITIATPIGGVYPAVPALTGRKLAEAIWAKTMKTSPDVQHRRH